MPAYPYYPNYSTYQNPYLTGSYQPQYVQPIQQTTPPQVVQAPTQSSTATNGGSTGVNWVQGEAGARSWLTAPNTTVLLMDSEADRFYLKSTDASGMPLPLRIFEYTEKLQETNKTIQEPSKDKVDYATKDDLNALRMSIKDEVAEMFSGVATKAKKKVIGDE